MKKLLLLLVLCIPTGVLAQTNQHYLYNIIALEDNIIKEGLKVKVDDGKTIERLKDKKGKEVKFATPAAALMYFISQGWELYGNGASTQGEMALGYGESKTTSYWIMRKPCTKEEFDKAVDDGTKK